MSSDLIVSDTSAPRHSTSGSPSNRAAELWWALAIAALISLLSFYLNLHEGSTLVETDVNWSDRVHFHTNYHPFSHRIFTTTLLVLAYDSLDLSYLQAFEILQYTLMLGLGPLFFVYLRRLGFEKFFAYLGVVFLLTAYPILAAFHKPNYTYDDLWQHLAVVGALVLAFDRRFVWSGLCFAMGVAAREPTLLLYPAFLFILWNEPSRPIRRIIAGLIPVAVAILILVVLDPQPESPQRFHNFDKNFLDPRWAKNTAYSMLASFGAFWVLAPAAVARLGQSLAANPRLRTILIGGALSVPLVLVSTLTMALARESRIFFSPFPFVIPLGLVLLRYYRLPLRRLLASWWLLVTIPVVGSAVYGGIFLARLLFPSFLERAWPAFAQIHLGVHIGIASCVVLVLMWDLLRQTRPSSSTGV